MFRFYRFPNVVRPPYGSGVNAYLPGLLTGFSLIIAIGAQNAYVLRQGLSRNHIGVVIAICALADVALIAAGVAGVGALVASHQTVLLVVTWLGAAYLVWFGIGSLRRARHAEGLSASGMATRRSLPAVAGTALALTFLNPHVYLDTVLMLGTVAAGYGSDKWGFGAGAMSASVVWFSGLGLGARAAAPQLSRPAVWRVLDTVIGITMIGIAALLVLG